MSFVCTLLGTFGSFGPFIGLGFPRFRFRVQTFEFELEPFIKWNRLDSTAQCCCACRGCEVEISLQLRLSRLAAVRQQPRCSFIIFLPTTTTAISTAAATASANTTATTTAPIWLLLLRLLLLLLPLRLLLLQHLPTTAWEQTLGDMAACT